MLNQDSNDFNYDYRNTDKKNARNNNYHDSNYRNINSQDNNAEYQRNYQSEAYQTDPYETTATEAERYQKNQNPNYLNPESFDPSEYKQEGYYGQTHPELENMQGKAHYTYTAYEGETIVSESKDSKFKELTEEVLSWIKSLVLERPTSASEKAKSSRESYAWTVFLGTLALIGAIKGLFNSIGAGRNSGYVISRLFATMAVSAVVYFIYVLVIFIAQKSNKVSRLSRSWYQAFNVAVIPVFPLLCAFILNIIFGSFFSPTMMIIAGVIDMSARVTSILILHNILIKEFEGSKVHEWKVYGLIVLLTLLVSMLTGLIAVTPIGINELLSVLY